MIRLRGAMRRRRSEGSATKLEQDQLSLPFLSLVVVIQPFLHAIVGRGGISPMPGYSYLGPAPASSGLEVEETSRCTRATHAKHGQTYRQSRYCGHEGLHWRVSKTVYQRQTSSTDVMELDS